MKRHCLSVMSATSDGECHQQSKKRGVYSAITTMLPSNTNAAPPPDFFASRFQLAWSSAARTTSRKVVSVTLWQGCGANEKVNQLFAETAISYGVAAIFVNYQLLPNIGFRPSARVVSPKC